MLAFGLGPMSLLTSEKEEEENLFAKKAGCQRGLQPINAGYRKHKHYMPKQLNQCHVTCLSTNDNTVHNSLLPSIIYFFSIFYSVNNFLAVV